MMNSSGNNIVTGIVRGRTIELERALGYPDGQQVVVSICSRPQSEPRSPGEGIKRSTGAWMFDDDGLDEFLEWTRRSRKQSRPDVA